MGRPSVELLLLRLGEEVRLVAGLGDRHAGGEAERVGRAERVDVEAAAVADAPGLRSAPAERQRDRVVGLTGDDPHGGGDRAVARA